MTCDTWHVTCDMSHVTCDIWWGVNILLKCQLSCSYGLGKTVFEDWEERDNWVTQLINHEGFCWTAPATPGLSKSYAYFSPHMKKIHSGTTTKTPNQEIQCFPYAGFFLFTFYKVAKLISGGSVINGATPSSFRNVYDHFDHFCLKG